MCVKAEAGKVMGKRERGKPRHFIHLWWELEKPGKRQETSCKFQWSGITNTGEAPESNQSLLRE